MWWIKYIWPAVVYVGLHGLISFAPLADVDYETLTPLYHIRSIWLYFMAMYCLWIDKDEAGKTNTFQLIGVLGGLLILITVNGFLPAEIWESLLFSTIIRGIYAISLLLIAIFYAIRFNSIDNPNRRDRRKKRIIIGLVAWMLFSTILFAIDSFSDAAHDGPFSWTKYLIDILFGGTMRFVEMGFQVYLYYLWFREIVIRRREALKAAPYELIEQIGKE